MTFYIYCLFSEDFRSTLLKTMKWPWFTNRMCKRSNEVKKKLYKIVMMLINIYIPINSYKWRQNHQWTEIIYLWKITYSIQIHRDCVLLLDGRVVFDIWLKESRQPFEFQYFFNACNFSILFDIPIVLLKHEYTIVRVVTGQLFQEQHFSYWNWNGFI